MRERAKKNIRALGVRNPLVWLRRIRHRKGYGVHSPFAYDLLTQVIYSPGRYYDYAQLDKQFPRWSRLLTHRRRAVDRLLFRLANRWQPERIFAPEVPEREYNYLRQGCRHAKFTSAPSHKGGETVQPSAKLLVYIRDSRTPLPSNVGEGSILVVDRLRKNRRLWRQLLHNEQHKVTFDLYDVGIAVFDRRLQRQDYIVNW